LGPSRIQDRLSFGDGGERLRRVLLAGLEHDPEAPVRDSAPDELLGSERIRDAGLDRYIDAYALSYEIGVTKPGRGIFIEACRLLGVGPADTLMVGDDATSDGGATEAGLRFYLLGPYGRGGERGLARVVEIVDASRAVDA